jgi:uncharacterized protein YraI
MRYRVNLVIVAILAGLAASSFAQEANEPPKKIPSPNDVNAISSLSFPYAAEITGDDIYLRSGPGTNYYNCGKLRRGDKVQVVSARFSWSCIVPPAGSFSWISTQYVSIDSTNLGVGIVTGDNVRVYAGSDYVRPIHSTTLQLKLNRGDKIKPLGEEKENYYKIAPPTGAYLWVSSEYIKPLGPIGGTVEAAGLKFEPNEIGVFVMRKGSGEDESLKVYYALEKQFQAERAKPIEQQNYASIKKAFSDIAANKEAGKAARYAEFMIKQIERCEFALVAGKEVQLQNEQLQTNQERIDKMRATRLAKLEDLGRFAVIGRLKTSSIFGSEPQLKHYRITDESDKIICYALPTGQASTTDLSKLIDHKVGLVGTVEAHLQMGKALVKFTEAVELK